MCDVVSISFIVVQHPSACSRARVEQDMVPFKSEAQAEVEFRCR
jgi:hypothetical protein